MTCRTMTTTAGNPIANKQNTIPPGTHGPFLMQDYQLLEKVAKAMGGVPHNNSTAPARSFLQGGSPSVGIDLM